MRQTLRFVLFLTVFFVAPALGAQQTRQREVAQREQTRQRAALVAALIEHESGGDPAAVNKVSGALGLGQILPSTRPQCKDPDSTECAAEKARLLDPAYNRRLMASYLKIQERICLSKTSRKTSIKGIIMSYGGWNRTAATARRLRLPERWCHLERRWGKRRPGPWKEAATPQAVKDVLRLYRKHLKRSASSSTSRRPTSTSSSSKRRSRGSAPAALR